MTMGVCMLVVVISMRGVLLFISY